MIGRRWVLVPVVWCGHCRQELPVDHDCRTIRQLFVLAANTVQVPPSGLDRIREKAARRPWWALWRSRTQKTAPEAPGAATNTHTTRESEES